MKSKKQMKRINLFLIGLILMLSCAAEAQEINRLMEYLDRGLVAVNTENGQVYLSWRLLGVG